MIDDAHTLRREGVDVVVGFVETHGRADTEARIGDLEVVPRRQIEYRGVRLAEMDLQAIRRRRPGCASSTNWPTRMRLAAVTRSGTRTSRSCSTPVSA